MNDAMYMGFESYLNNELPADEKKQFDDKLRSDAAFRQQFELYKETTRFLEVKFSSETAAFKQNLQKISGDHFSAVAEKDVRVISFKPFYYAVAASVAIVFGLLFFNQGDPQYNDFNQHETAVFTERSGDAQLKQAQDFFNARDYPKAVSAFEKVNLDRPELRYYYAIALIETANYAKAETVLNNLRAGTSAYKDKATWYLALSNLKQNKPGACKTLLQQLPEGADDYQKAQELIDDLD